MRIDDLARLVRPDQTVLLLGAGATVPSGAPTGTALATYLAGQLNPRPASTDLSEVAGIYEDRQGRRGLVDAVRRRLRGLQPTGGLLDIPAFAWRAIYSTNFDRLVEESYRIAGANLSVVRSNFDFSAETADHTTLYKIHGCMTQDVALGHQARMVLTEFDYDEYENFRQSLFSSLKLSMMTADTLVIGQSLSDAHLRELCKQVGGLRDQGARGRVFLLAYDYDEDRARLYERRGIQVVGGSLDTFVHALASQDHSSQIAYSTESRAADALPPGLAAATIDVQHAAGLAPDAVRLFNGAPASYADVRSELTIPRAAERRVAEAQTGVRGFFLVLSGAAGVGKTTLARRLMLQRAQSGFSAWEHRNDYPLDVSRWMQVEASLRKAGRQGVLLLDDCTRYLPAVNGLVDRLGELERPHLRIVATANASHWRTRAKSNYFFSRGTLERISLLVGSDIDQLLHLLDRKAEIRRLVENDFLQLGWREKVRRLQDRCSADMYVCLKNIFRNERLDNILLQEFTDLEADAREVYRHVAALQSMGTRVHRQLVMRLLGLDWAGLDALLARMDAVVSEYDIAAHDGLYGWTTRHDVIAHVIAIYEFADQSEIHDLIHRLITGLNPTVHMERETARAIATEDMGIARLDSLQDRWSLLRLLIETVPGERVPRRRLIRSLLDNDKLNDADAEIGRFETTIGPDDIVNRYKATLAIRRAEDTEGILEGHRRAMLLEAKSLAELCVSRRPTDRYNYRVLGDVGMALGRRFGELDVLRCTISNMLGVEAEFSDPDFRRERRRLETALVRLERDATSPPPPVEDEPGEM